MSKPTDYLVLDMDQGLLRREPTRRAALAWLMNHAMADHVYARHTYGPGAYEYTVGLSGEPDDTSSWFIERASVAIRGGWNPEQPALYPHPDRPDEMDQAVVDELDMGNGRSWR